MQWDKHTYQNTVIGLYGEKKTTSKSEKSKKFPSGSEKYINNFVNILTSDKNRRQDYVKDYLFLAA